MIKIQSPYKYIQGPGIIDNFCDYISYLGNKFFILSGNSIMIKKKDSLARSFAQAGLKYHLEKFNKEATRREYERIANLVIEGGYDCIIGLGGGKVIDTAKAAANKANVGLITAPTIASNDSPCSSMAVIYNENGEVDEVQHYKTNPELVIVDSKVIADSPVRTLVAGMGDALATYFEARICYDYGYTNPIGSEVSNTAIAMGKLCYELLSEYGAPAKTCVENKTVAKPLENIIEANIYLSGLGFESGGLSCAHSIQNALTTIPECRKATMHGDRVAFGTICLLVLEECWDEVNEVIKFCKTIGLPTTLEEMSIKEDVSGKIQKIIPVAFTDSGSYRMPPNTTKEKMFYAIMHADKLGQEYQLLK